LPSGAELAVDPTLSVLAIYQRTNASLECTMASLRGVLAVYGMHPTGVPNTNELYHGDIFGFAVRAAEGELASAPVPVEQAEPVVPTIEAERQRESAPPRAKPVIVGLANGVEGDVSPKILYQSVVEARAHGRTLGRAIARLARQVTDLAPTGDFTHRSLDLYFPNAQYDDLAEHRLCSRAELGVAAAGGARDGPTRLRVIPAANAGFLPNRPSSCHEEKLPLRAGTSSQYDFPTTGPIGLVAITGRDGGTPFVIATAPGEVSTITGERISNAVKAHLPAGSSVALVGLTNQYFQYFATRREYKYQYYEGASTLYGPNSERFLVRSFDCLSAHLNRKMGSCGAPLRSTRQLRSTWWLRSR
jgi:neutral ceramidase